MPKKVNISSNERIDLEDFQRTSSGYTLESDNFSRDKLLQARHSVIAGGFRIELSNQATNPGEFTIFNGLALNQDGGLLNNEQQVNDARTLTLVGAGSTFYVEIELTEAESDVDARAFWDPTFSGNTPPGQEFSLNVATRLTPDWQVPTPVSTTGFEIDTISSSLKIPIAVLTLNGSNEITGISAVNAATVLEEDTLVAALTLQVLDSTIFPDTGTADLGVGTANVESVTITANDRTTGTITIFPASINTHSAGAILRQTGVTAAFVPETSAAVPTTGTDRKRMLFKGDETRGSALSASKESAIARSDQDLRSQKDHVDFLAAQIREMKFGDLRPDVDSKLPPGSADFSSSRHYDYAGSIPGAKSHVITIGDNVTSHGDLNSVANDLTTILQQANDSLSASFGGSILVRAGTYTLNGAVGIDRPVTLIFEQGVTWAAGGVGGFEIINLSPVEIVNLPANNADTWRPYISPGITVSVNTVGLNVTVIDSFFGKADLIGAIVASDSVHFKAVRCSFEAGDIGAQGVINTGAPQVSAGIEFTDCNISYTGAADSNATSLLTDLVDNIKFVNCVFDAGVSTGGARAHVYLSQGSGVWPMENVEFTGCKFLATGVSAPNGVRAGVFLSGSTMKNVIVRDCVFDFQIRTVGFTFRRALNINTLVDISDVLVENCDFSPMGTKVIPGTLISDRANILYIGNFSGRIDATTVRGCRFGTPITGADHVPAYFQEHITLESKAGEGVLVDGNSFSTFNYGVFVIDGSATIVNNSFSNLSTTLITSTQQAISLENIGGSATERLIVSNNKIEQDINNDSSVYGVFSEPNDGNLLVSDNDIHINNSHTASFTLEKGIYVLPLTTGNSPTQHITITGNTANVTGYTPTGIELSIVDQVETESLITGNNVNVKSTVATSLLYGIRAQKSSIGFHESCTISGNIVLTDAVFSTSTGYGIRCGIPHATISGNTITQDIATISTGILFAGSDIAVVGNTIVSTVSTTSGTGYGIRTTTLGTTSSNLTISDNTIKGVQNMLWGIEVDIALDIECRGLTITGNTITQAAQFLASNGGIHVVNPLPTADPTLCGGWNISGNTVVEEVSNTGDSVRYGLLIQGGGTPRYTTGVAVNSNVVHSTFQAGVRNTKAITVIGITDLVVSGNSVRRLTSSDGPSNQNISLSDIQDFILTDNHLHSSFSTQDVITFNGTCFDGIYDNNVGIPSLGVTGTTASVVSGNSNKFVTGAGGLS